MAAIGIKKDYFSGGSFVATAEAGGLGNVIRYLAQDMARVKLAAQSLTLMTDSSGGTNGAGTVALVPVPTTVTDVSAAGGATTASINAQLTLIADAQGKLGSRANEMLTALGLPLMLTNLVAIGTIAAEAATATGGTGAATPSFATFAATATAVRNNYASIARALNQVAAAIDNARLTDNSGGSASATLTLVAPPALVASATGSDGVAIADVNAFLAASRNAVATLAAYALVLDGLTSDPLRIVAAD